MPGAAGGRAAEVAEGRWQCWACGESRPGCWSSAAATRSRFGETSGGFYFASLPEGLPGQVAPIKDRYAGVLLYRDGETRARGLFDWEVSDAILHDHRGGGRSAR